MKKGFTLIELLAVIAIVAIIALITIPIALNSIETSKKNSIKASAYGYVDAVNRYNEMAEMPENQESALTPIADGENINISTITVNAKGRKPELGNVTIVDGEVTNATLCFEKYEAIYENKKVTSVNKSSNCVIEEPESFVNDSWRTIAANTTSDKYHVGDTKCVALTGLTTTNDNGCSNGEFKVRIANKTACTNGETSTTACGFVVEFVDVIALHNMNPSGEYKGTQYSYGWNVDGYPASAMHQEYFANNATNSIYAKLPSDLQNEIINTTVVSGHGSTSGETNFTSTDKLYLLSTREVGFDVSYDTAKEATRILDYYNTNNNNASRIKQYNGSNKIWWLRSANSNGTNSFYYVNTSGGLNSSIASNTNGVAPAFRIG